MDQDCVNETPAKDKFNELLVRWVSDSIGSPVESAKLGTDLSYPDRDSGCETCGWGSGTISFDIWYYLTGDTQVRYTTVDESPLDWLAYTLFEWEENHPKDAAE